MDDHSRGEELSLASDGAIMSEEEIKEASRHHDADELAPGEIPSPEEEAKHLHHMPEGEVQYIDEEGKRVL